MPAINQLYQRRKKKKFCGASEETRHDNVLLQSRVHLSVVHFTSALPRRCKRSVFPQVFDKFAEFYGSIYGNRQRCSRRCSTCQITRMPISLIGCSYAEECAVECDASRRYFRVNHVQLHLSFAAQLRRHVNDINFLSSLLFLFDIKGEMRKSCRPEKSTTVSALNSFLHLLIIQFFYLLVNDIILIL